MRTGTVRGGVNDWDGVVNQLDVILLSWEAA